jgi:hypothetical protein
MTTLDIDKALFAPTSDLSNVLMICQSSESSVEGSRSSVRTYAGGRRRVITMAGNTETVSVSFDRMTRDEYISLSDLLGVLILFRDQRGRRTFGVFTSIGGEEDRSRPDRVTNVAITIEEITYSEVVEV